jgi:DNA-binding NarL/FixJ family response regulator
MDTVSNAFKPLSIFILDGDKVYLEYLISIIANCSMPISIRTFTNTDELLKHLDRKPNLVLIDFNLGTKNGDRITAHATINNIEQYSPNQPIVLMSSEAIRPLLEEYYKYRNVTYLVKSEEMELDLLSLLAKNLLLINL